MAKMCSGLPLRQEGDVEHGSENHEQDRNFKGRNAADDEERLSFMLPEELLCFRNDRWQVHGLRDFVLI